MIHVSPAPEPPTFDRDVRQPGRRAIAEGRDPLPACWTACLPDLRKAYQSVCAYLCVIVPPGVGASSVDHFAPKSKRRDLTYEWSNYRFVSSLMNARKHAFEDVLDPFEIDDDWFELELSTLQVRPSASCTSEVRSRVMATIQRLRLNDQECIDARSHCYDAYLAKDVSFDHLLTSSPFVAREMIRQGLGPAGARLYRPA